MRPTVIFPPLESEFVRMLSEALGPDVLVSVKYDGEFDGPQVVVHSDGGAIRSYVKKNEAWRLNVYAASFGQGRSLASLVEGKLPNIPFQGGAVCAVFIEKSFTYVEETTGGGAWFNASGVAVIKGKTL